MLHNNKIQLQKFTEQYNMLNEEQRLAVDTIEGPVMVIAGPGTGKTQILSARIGKILLDTDALPENLLCLTYTDAGVVAMRRRLLQFIGPDAYKVNIHTFHSFCNEVIQENLSQFEKTALDPISELEQTELYKQLIDAFPKNHPLKRYRGDVYYEVNNLKKLFSDIKREGWKPAEIITAIDAYVKELPEREEFVYKTSRKGKWNAGELKPAYHEEVERMDKLKAAIAEFDNYQALMRKRNLYDFDDMISWVIKAFEENSNLLANYQERYLYILVDEFQDTSGTQNKIVELLINYWEKPNVFVVGDDDQSIYRFQGANVENMLQFANKYNDDLLKVVLTKNYRSTQPVLDVSKTVIDNNNERLVKQIDGLSKNLQAAHTKMATVELPVLHEYETMHEEMLGITLAVQKLVADGIKPGDIGIIYKENKYGAGLAAYLQLKEIPFYTKRSINAFEQPVIQKLITLLTYLDAEHDMPYGGDELLFEILHYDWFTIPPSEIAKLSVEANASRYKENPVSFRQLIVDKAANPVKDLFTQNIHPNIAKASEAIEMLIGDVPNFTLVQLAEKAVRTSGLLNTIMQSPDKHFLLQVVHVFFEFLKEETRRNKQLSLHELVNIISLMQDQAIPLPLTQVSGNEKGINLLTAHGSKGLEFEYVFFAGCNASFWEKKKKPAGGYKLPPTLLAAAPGPDAALEELRRLFYVALTRAKQYLIISYSKFNNAGKEMEPSRFIAEIQQAHDITAKKIFFDKEVLSDFMLLQLQEAKAPEIDKLEKDFITPLVEKFVMNVTALNNYLKCPLDFYFKTLIRIPSGKNENIEFGSAVHHALEQLFKKMSARSGTDGQDSGKETFPSVELFIKDFEWYMYRHRENFTKEQFDRRLEYGQTILKDYYEKYIGSFNKIVSVERTISKVTVNGVPLKGKLDKLEFDGLTVNVVDYKTGNYEKAKAKLKGPDDKEPNGGDYWRQAVFYKLLIDNYEQKKWKALSTEFDFIEPDKKKNYQKEKILVSPEDLTTVTHQITEVWQKIQAHNFYTGCGKEECHWCQFVKTNNMAIALHDIPAEDEEN